MSSLWVLKSTSNSNSDHSLSAGAICVHPAGYLITVTHGILPPGPAFANSTQVTIMAKRNGTNVYYGTTIIEENSFGLTLLRVEGLKNVVVDAVSFPSSISLKRTDEISAVFDDESSCSQLFGRVMYPFRGDFIISENESNPFTFSTEDRHRRDIKMVAPKVRWQKSNYISDNDDTNEVVTEFVGYVKSLPETMPLIQVDGLTGKIMDGICGVPVFATKGNKFIGLAALAIDLHYFLIPVQVVEHVILSKIDFIRSQQPRLSDGSSGSGSGSADLVDGSEDAPQET